MDKDVRITRMEERLLALAEKGIAEGSYSDAGALYRLAVTGKRGPALVIALCQVVQAARARHKLCRAGSHVGSGARRDHDECRAFWYLDHVQESTP